MSNYTKLKNILNSYKPERSCFSSFFCCSEPTSDLPLYQSKYIDGIRAVADKISRGEAIYFGDFHGNSYAVDNRKSTERTPIVRATEAINEDDVKITVDASQRIVKASHDDRTKDEIFRLFLYAIYNYLTECLQSAPDNEFCFNLKHRLEDEHNFASFIISKPYLSNETLVAYVDNFVLAMKERLPLCKLVNKPALPVHVEQPKVGTGTLALPTREPSGLDSAASPVQLGKTREGPSTLLQPPAPQTKGPNRF